MCKKMRLKIFIKFSYYYNKSFEKIIIFVNQQIAQILRELMPEFKLNYLTPYIVFFLSIYFRLNQIKMSWNWIIFNFVKNYKITKGKIFTKSFRLTKINKLFTSKTISWIPLFDMRSCKVGIENWDFS